jgi:hypothetical protein
MYAKVDFGVFVWRSKRVNFSQLRRKVLHVVSRGLPKPATAFAVLPKASKQVANLHSSKQIFPKESACLQFFLAYSGSAILNRFQPDQQRAMMQRRSGSLGISHKLLLSVLLKRLSGRSVVRSYAS